LYEMCLFLTCDVSFLQQHNSVCLQIAATLCITNLIDKNEDGKHLLSMLLVAIARDVSVCLSCGVDRPQKG